MEQAADIADCKIRILKDSKYSEIQEQSHGCDHTSATVGLLSLKHETGVPGRHSCCHDKNQCPAGIGQIVYITYNKEPSPLELFRYHIVYEYRQDDKYQKNNRV